MPAAPGLAKYPHVFSPLQIGPHRLKNRILMGSMHTGLEDGPDAAERLSAYFAERARGGVGMIITGGITPHESGGKGAKLTGTDEVPMHRAVTDAVHAADPDVKICMQILHSGSLANVPEPIAPSPVRPRISPAALFVNVTARIDHGDTRSTSSSQPMRWMATGKPRERSEGASRQ